MTIRSRKLHVQGEVELPGSVAPIGFEVSTGAGIRPGGQILFLRDISVSLNPDSTLRTTFPILLSSPIDVDLGYGCRIETFVIGNRSIWLQAVSIISPGTSSRDSPNLIAPIKPIKRRASYSYDLAALLSSIMCLNGGLISRWLRLS